MNNHECGIAPDAFVTDANLAAFYTVLSTNVDRAGKPFVSGMEAKDAPVYGTQWHPEKNAFEWDPQELIPHDAAAAHVCTYMARFFVDECRKSTHTMDYATLMRQVIWNYAPVFTGLNNDDFTQTYFF